MIAKKKRLLIQISIIIVVLFVLMGGVFAFLYMKTDLFKTNETLFYKYAFQNKKLIEVVDQDWIKQYQQKVSNHPYTNQGSITFNGKSSEENVNKKANILNNMKLSFKGQTDLANLKQAQTVKASYSDKDVFTIDYLRGQDVYALKSDEVVTKYVGIENNKLQEYFTKMGKENISLIPDKIEPVDVINLLQVDDEIKNYLQENYLSIILQNIPAENYRKKKEEISIDGQSVNSNIYELHLKENELDTISKALLEQLKIDDKMLDYIMNKFDTLQKKNGISIFDDELVNKLSTRLDNQEILILKRQGMTKEILVKLIQSQIEIINRNDYKEENNYIFCVYETNGNLIKTEILEGENGISIEYVQNGEEENIRINTQQMELINEEENRNKNQIEIVKLKKQDQYQLNITNITSINDKETGKYIFQFQNNGDLNGNLLQQSFIIGYNKQNKEVSTTIYENKQDFSSEVKIEDLTSDNLVKLNDYEKEYNQSLVTSINKRLEQLYNEKMVVLGIDPTILASDTIVKMVEFNNKFISVDKQEEKRMQEAIINSELELYQGDSVMGESVQFLIEKVQKFNKIQEGQLDKPIILNVENTDYNMTEENIRAIKQNIKNNATYRVRLEYNEQTTLVNKVRINMIT